MRRALILTLLAAIMLAGCGVARHTGSHGWPVWGGNAQNTHFSDLRSINARTVGRLGVAWKRSEGPRQYGWETFPVVVGDTIYYTTNTGEVLAVNARTGARRWSYSPHVNFFADPYAVAVAPASRGVTVAQGRVYELTYDDQLIALDALTGKRLWRVRVANPSSGAAENSPGTYWHGEIIIGGPAGDAGLRGFVAAYSAKSGARLWRRFVVPSRAHGWTARSPANGGGDVWMPPTVDPATGVVYVGTGNPTPAFTPAVRPGCDRWTDATLALNGRTGALLWGHTATCGDAWDYDIDQSPMLLKLRRGDRVESLVADASKSGFVYFLDAATGGLAARSPSLVPFSQPHRQPTTGGVTVCPGDFGGIEYGPSAYSSGTGLFYVGATAACMRYRAQPVGAAADHRPGADDLGGTATPVGRTSGIVAAVNPRTGRIAWRRRLPQAVRGGMLATAGGLVFTGDDNGYLYALDADTGRVRWRFDTGLRFGSAPFAYTIGGREYIAVVAGGSAAPRVGTRLAKSGGELYVFALSP
jgi:PQQ-dependent dehydrogenase (methanol/ethanol family)